jgi:hypothetical protein
MNTKYRLELLEAFASTQPADFFGFTTQYRIGHPEPTEEPVAVAIAEPQIEPVVEEVTVKVSKKKKPAEE